MKSLLEAAEDYRDPTQSMVATVEPSEVPGAVDGIISTEEQQDILQEIDRLSGHSRIKVTPDLFKIEAVKNGVLFPLLVNIVALLILGSGILATKYYFDRKGEQMILASAQQQSAEGNLIKEIKKETDEKLAAKENEIKSIQENMQQVESERLALESDMNNKISEREAQLQAEMELALEAEREKLQSQGLSGAQIDGEIKKLELEQNRVFDQQLAQYREKARLEKIKLEENLNQLQNEYNSKLETVNEDRARIEAEAKTRQEELTTQMESRTKELESKMTKAQRELQDLTNQKEQENLVENQILGFYRNIENLMKVGKLDLASVELKNLKNYLYDDSVINLEGITQRRKVDLFVIDSLDQLINSTHVDQQQNLDTMSLIDDADRLKEIWKTVANADQQLAVGNREMAELMYRNALEKIPEINKSHHFFLDTMATELEAGYEQLDDIQNRYNQLEEQRKEREVNVANNLAAADEDYKSGNFSQALKSYRSAIEATGFDNMKRTSERLVESGSNLAIAPFKEKVNQLNGQIENLETTLSERTEERDELTGKLTSSENEINQLSGEVDQLKSDLASLNQDLEAKKQELSSNNEQLEGSSVNVASLSTELENTQTEMTILKQQLESSRSEVTTLNDRLNTEQDQVVTLKDKIQTYEERVDEMRRKLEEEKAKAAENEGKNLLIDKDMGELTTLKAQLNRLNKSYTEFELVADNLKDNLEGNSATIDALYDFFNKDAVEDVMPGIGEYLRSFSSVYINAGQEIGLYDAVSLLYDVNSQGSNADQIRFLEDKKAEYSDNDAMIEIISQLQQSLRGN